MENLAAWSHSMPNIVPSGVFPGYVENWDDYFQWIAEAVAIKSKDPKCKVGAVIVSEDKLILSTGFNGLARRVFDDEDILENAEEKIKIICHAEANAIYNAARLGVSISGASIYVTKFPCLACCNAIVQAGIGRIHTHDSRFWDDDPLDSDHRRKRVILKQSGIKVDAPFHSEFVPLHPISLKQPKIEPGRTTSTPLFPEVQDKPEDRQESA